MKSIYQKPEGVKREAGTGTVKVYGSGLVGFQPSGVSHEAYKASMQRLSGISPQNGSQLLTGWKK